MYYYSYYSQSCSYYSFQREKNREMFLNFKVEPGGKTCGLNKKIIYS